MIPVGNKPILEYVVNALQQSGIVDLIMVVGYKREKIMDHFGDGHAWGVNIQYVEQTPQLGTAHALRQVSHLIKDHFIVINGDTIVSPSAIKEMTRYKVGDAAILTVNVDTSQSYGVVNAHNGVVKNIHEKPKGDDFGNTVNAGVYKFSPRIFEFLEFMEISERGDYEITDAIKKMIREEYSVRAIHSDAIWMDAPHPWDLLKLNATTLAAQKPEVRGTVEPGVEIKGPVYVGENTTIRSGSYIVGPVSIGDNCEIGPNAVIMHNTSIGSNCTIDPFTRISDSIIMSNVRVSSFSHMSRSIIGEGVNLGPQFLAESGNTKTVLEDRLVPANVGAMIGDNCDIAGRVLTQPGVIVGVRCRIGSGNVVGMNMPDNMRIL